MARFHYRALDSTNQPVAGEIDADSVAQALAQLESSGHSVLSIGLADLNADYADPRTPARHVGESPFATDAEQLELALHMQLVMERGQAIIPALDAYAQELPAGRSRRQLDASIRVLKRGDVAAATAALRTMPTFWIPLISAATATGEPGRILHDFLDESQRAEELRRQWWLTLAYPLVIALATGAVMTLLSVLIVPTFRSIFLDFGLRLPLLTRLAIGLSEFIVSGRILILGAVVLLGALALWLTSTVLPGGVRERLSIGWRMFGGRSTVVARFSQFAADLLEAQIAIPSVLRIASFAVGCLRLRRAALRLARDIESGAVVTITNRRSPLTATVCFALTADLPPAARIRLLREVSNCYADRAGRRLSWTRGVFEPIAMCAIGLIVGAYVLALFMPLFMLIRGLA